MSFATDQPLIWPVPADWGRPVRESLGWLTEVLVAPTYGIAQKRSLRAAPRRSFAFDVVAEKRERRLLDTLRFDGGSRQWMLPIWPDGQVLAEQVASGADSIPCLTAGYDFVAGGQAVLWAAMDQWEIVTIDAVGEDGLTLTDEVSALWRAGSRLWPLRRARIQDATEESSWHDDASRLPLQFLIDEPCDWPAVLPGATYRDHPVLQSRPDAKAGLDSDFGRYLSRVDNDVGVVTEYDTVGLPVRHQDHVWKLFGRAERSAFRSLAYGLAGRFGNLWVPSWNSDLRLVASVGAADTTLSVEWCGYTLYGREQIGRRDIRIELFGGAVYLRRITGSVEAGAAETLAIDAALGVAVSPSAVRSVSFVGLSQLASDLVEIEHVTDGDGLARSRTKWEAIRDV